MTPTRSLPLPCEATIDLLTPRDVSRLLHEHGLAPRRAAGQNFLIDPNTVRRIVAAAELDPREQVLEIGPGLGSLTLGLSDAAGRVIAVEIDAGLVRALEETVGHLDHVEVVHADALRTDLAALIGAGTARVVANLPYRTATPLLFHALACPAVTDLLVMVQREVGERWAARVGDGSYGAVSVKLALVAHVEVALAIPRTVFHPAPRVDSVMVRISRREDAPTGERLQRLNRLVDAAFAARRKTLRNTLATVVSREELARAAERADIDLGARAETLTVDDVRRLHEALPPGPYDAAS